MIKFLFPRTVIKENLLALCYLQVKEYAKHKNESK